MTPKQAARKMLGPRHTRAGKGFQPGWYYIDRNQIEILADVKNAVSVHTMCVRLSRKQLEQALEIMRLTDRCAVNGGADRGV